jgi:hypothetical protein
MHMLQCMALRTHPRVLDIFNVTSRVSKFLLVAAMIRLRPTDASSPWRERSLDAVTWMVSE